MTDEYEWEFKSVPDIFVFEKLIINESEEIPRQKNFGILDRDYTTEYKQPEATAAPVFGGPNQWRELIKHVKHLNATSDTNVSYKLVFVLRHGVGVHNVVMKALSAAVKRGDVTEPKIWNKKYSHLDGAEPGEVYVKIVDDQPDDQIDQENKNDEPSLPRSSLSDNGKIEWVDAPLVAKGITQARKLAGLWKEAVENNGMPWPQSIYTSPLARCLETTRLVFKDIVEPEDGQTTAIVPVVKEAARERMTNHTCDQRRSLSWIKEKYPKYRIEEGFAEDDTFWTPDVKLKEEVEQHVERKKALLEDIFEHDNNQVISLTAHSFALTAILLAVGAKKFRISECTMVPILIRAEKKKAEKKVDDVTTTTPAPEEVPASAPSNRGGN